jgi:hypothetical protein
MMSGAIMKRAKNACGWEIAGKQKVSDERHDSGDAVGPVRKLA